MSFFDSLSNLLGEQFILMSDDKIKILVISFFVWVNNIV